jgi:RNA polymerase sigma factor (sigma-70 family)
LHPAAAARTIGAAVEGNVADREHVSDELELERSAAAGDREAFGVLYERYCDRVHDFLIRMVRDPAEAADLTQETFVRAMRALSAERAGAASLHTWLFKIARNLALNRIERTKRLRPLDRGGGDADGGAESSYYELPDDAPGPSDAIERRELAKLVWDAAVALEPKQRTLLELHVRQGLDSAQIAEVMGVSKGNAYTMVSRLKDSFEQAVGALMMFRIGRRKCAELDGLLLQRRLTDLSPEVRRVVDLHIRRCETCSGERRRLVSAASILGALVAMGLPLALRRRTAEAAWEEYCSTPPPAAGMLRGWGGASRFGGRLALSDPSIAARVVIAGLVLSTATVVGVCVVAPAVSDDDTAHGQTGRAGAPVASPETAAAGATVDARDGAPAEDPDDDGAEPAAPAQQTAAASTLATQVAVTAGAAHTATVAAVRTAEVLAAVATPTVVAVAPTAQAPTAVPATAVPPDAPPGASPCGDASVLGAGSEYASFAASFAALTNEYRAARGLPPLVDDARLQAAAAEYARFFVETQWRTHLPPAQLRSGVLVPGIHIDASCGDHKDRATRHGYPDTWVGENVVFASMDVTAEALFNDMFSFTHEDPGLPVFTHTGVACFSRQNATPPEFACVQVLGGTP